jgi:hypothetical protein
LRRFFGSGHKFGAFLSGAAAPNGEKAQVDGISVQWTVNRRGKTDSAYRDVVSFERLVLSLCESKEQ